MNRIKSTKQSMTIICLAVTINNSVAAATMLKNEAAKEAKQLKGGITTQFVVKPEILQGELFKQLGFSALQMGKQPYPLKVTGIFEHTSAANRGIEVGDQILKITIIGSDAQLIIERSGKEYEARLTTDAIRSRQFGGGDREYIAQIQSQNIAATKKKLAANSAVPILRKTLIVQEPPRGPGRAGVWLNGGIPYSEIQHINQYLTTADQASTGSPRYSTFWKHWDFAFGSVVKDRWRSVPRPAGRVDIDVGITRSGQFMYTRVIGGHYLGYPDMINEALAFIHSFAGEPVLYFPADMLADEVHLRFMLAGPIVPGLPRGNYNDPATSQVNSSTLQNNKKLWQQQRKRNLSNTIAKLQNQINNPRSSSIVSERAAFEIRRLNRIMQKIDE